MSCAYIVRVDERAKKGDEDRLEADSVANSEGSAADRIGARRSRCEVVPDIVGSMKSRMRRRERRAKGPAASETVLSDWDELW